MAIEESGEAIYTRDAAWLQGIANSLDIDIENNQLHRKGRAERKAF